MNTIGPSYSVTHAKTRSTQQAKHRRSENEKRQPPSFQARFSMPPMHTIPSVKHAPSAYTGHVDTFSCNAKIIQFRGNDAKSPKSFRELVTLNQEKFNAVQAKLLQLNVDAFKKNSATYLAELKETLQAYKDQQTQGKLFLNGLNDSGILNCLRLLAKSLIWEREIIQQISENIRIDQELRKAFYQEALKASPLEEHQKKSLNNLINLDTNEFKARLKSLAAEQEAFEKIIKKLEEPSEKISQKLQDPKDKAAITQIEHWIDSKSSINALYHTAALQLNHIWIHQVLVNQTRAISEKAFFQQAKAIMTLLLDSGVQMNQLAELHEGSSNPYTLTLSLSLLPLIRLLHERESTFVVHPPKSNALHIVASSDQSRHEAEYSSMWDDEKREAMKPKVLATVRALLEQKIDPSATDQNGKMPFELAKTPEIQSLLKKAHEDHQVKLEQQAKAAEAKRKDIIKELLALETKDKSPKKGQSLKKTDKTQKSRKELISTAQTNHANQLAKIEQAKEAPVKQPLEQSASNKPSKRNPFSVIDSPNVDTLEKERAERRSPMLSPQEEEPSRPLFSRDHTPPTLSKLPLDSVESSQARYERNMARFEDIFKVINESDYYPSRALLSTLDLPRPPQ